MCLTQSKVVRKCYQHVTKLLPDKTITVKVHGFKMEVPLAFGLTLNLAGTYASEKLMSQVFQESVKPGMTVVDIGAHVGYYSLLASKVPNVKVFSYEPEEANYNLLVKNLNMNYCDNVKPMRVAISDVNGAGRLYIGETSSDHSLSGNSENFEDVSCIKLDTLITKDTINGDYPVDIIKVDVEGSEFKVWNGMQGILADNPHLILFTEFNPKALWKSSVEAIAYYSVLKQRFSVNVIDEKAGEVKRISYPELMDMCEKTEYVNLVCKGK